MKYGDTIALLKESGLSPESLAKKICISDSTYRHWLKAPPTDKLPKEYEANIAAAVYTLLHDRVLSYDSKRVNKFLESNLPEYFQAAIGLITNGVEIFSDDAAHEENIAAVLFHLGNSAKHRHQVDKSSAKILKFASCGDAWEHHIKLLLNIIGSENLVLKDRLVAYGTLFYLILPFERIPGSAPVFGHIDDFGMLDSAIAYYDKRFPQLINRENL